jgi:hypothetical protein
MDAKCQRESVYKDSSPRKGDLLSPTLLDLSAGFFLTYDESKQTFVS